MALLDIESAFWGLRRQLEALAGRRLADGVLQQAGANGGASFAQAFMPGQGAHQDGHALDRLRNCIAAYEAAGFGAYEVTEVVWPIGRVCIEATDTIEAWMVQQHQGEADAPVCAYTAGVLVGFVNVLTGRRDVVCVERTCQAQGADRCRFDLLPARASDTAAVVTLDPDPFLSQQLNLLDLLFDRMPMGIAIIDRQRRLRRFNPTWASFVDHYTPTTAHQVLPGASLYELIPDGELVFDPILDRVFGGETVKAEALRSESGGIVSYWDAVFSPLYEGGQVVGVLDVVTDATERVRARQELEGRVAERTAEVQQRADEAQALFNVQQAITSRLDPDDVLQIIADEARRLTNTEMAAVYLVEGDELTINVVSGSVDGELIGYRLPLDGSIGGHVIETGRSFLVPDAEKERRIHAELVQQVGAKAFVIVPLLSGDTPIGTITVANKRSGRLGPDDERVLTMMASGAVIALENARLYEAEHTRREVAEGLREILAIINSNRTLPQILDYIVEQASQLMSASAVVLCQWQPDDGHVMLEAMHGLPLDVAETEPVLRPVEELPAELLTREANVVREITPSAKPRLPLHWLEEMDGEFGAYLGLPLIVGDLLYGSLGFYFAAPRDFDTDEIGLGVALADQAALAIENARLRQDAEQTAVSAERNRLARELHDAVTQTLFSASLIADVLPRIWERDEEQGRARLAELRELTRGALAEMRTLLLELRPATLTESSLAALLRQLAEAVIGRSRLPVDLELEEERALPPEVQVAMYRIAQESLNNIIKHAGATQVAMQLRFAPYHVELTVRDNGRGFALDDVGVQSLGLSIMRERAEKIGADLRVNSKIGEGTSIMVICPGV